MLHMPEFKNGADSTGKLQPDFKVPYFFKQLVRTGTFLHQPYLSLKDAATTWNWMYRLCMMDWNCLPQLCFAVFYDAHTTNIHFDLFYRFCRSGLLPASFQIAGT